MSSTFITLKSYLKMKNSAQIWIPLNFWDFLTIFTNFLEAGKWEVSLMTLVLTLMTLLFTSLYRNLELILTVDFEINGWDCATSSATAVKEFSRACAASAVVDRWMRRGRLRFGRVDERAIARAGLYGLACSRSWARGPREFGDVAGCDWPEIVLNWFFKQPLIFFCSDLDRFSSDFAPVLSIGRSGTRTFHLNGWIWILVNEN